MAFFTLVNSVRSKVRPFSRNLISSVTEAASINRVDKNRWKDRNVTFPLPSSLDFAHSRLNEFFLPGAQVRLDLSYLGHGHGFLDECVDQADAWFGWLVGCLSLWSNSAYLCFWVIVCIFQCVKGHRFRSQEIEFVIEYVLRHKTKMKAGFKKSYQVQVLALYMFCMNEWYKNHLEPGMVV